MGAAIVVGGHYVPDVYSRVHFNPLCFLQYENQSQSPEQWENVSVCTQYLCGFDGKSETLHCLTLASSLVKSIELNTFMELPSS